MVHGGGPPDHHIPRTDLPADAMRAEDPRKRHRFPLRLAILVDSCPAICLYLQRRGLLRETHDDALARRVSDSTSEGREAMPEAGDAEPRVGSVTPGPIGLIGVPRCRSSPTRRRRDGSLELVIRLLVDAIPGAGRRYRRRPLFLVLGLSLLTGCVGGTIERATERADSSSFDFLDYDPVTEGPIRYNPCEPVHYVINPSRAPEGGVTDIKEGIATVSEETGIEFIYDGLTKEPITLKRPIYQPGRYGRERWAPLLFGWVPKELLLKKNRHALGAGGSAYEKNQAGNLVYVSGIVSLNAEAELDPGFDEGETWGDVVLHELGHVVGLDHVEDVSQVMYAEITAGPAKWGDGDLAGLAKLGRSAGCVTPVNPVSLHESFHYAFIGDRLSLRVDPLERSDDCTVLAYKYQGIGLARGAVQTGCESWGKLNPLAIAYVSLTNKTKDSVAFGYDGFVIGAGSKYYRAIDISKFAEDPKAWFPKNGIMKARQRFDGWVAFRVPKGFKPKVISYIDGEDVLSVTLDGKPEAWNPKR